MPAVPPRGDRLTTDGVATVTITGTPHPREVWMLTVGSVAARPRTASPSRWARPRVGAEDWWRTAPRRWCASSPPRSPHWADITRRRRQRAGDRQGSAGVFTDFPTSFRFIPASTPPRTSTRSTRRPARCSVGALQGAPVAGEKWTLTLTAPAQNGVDSLFVLRAVGRHHGNRWSLRWRRARQRRDRGPWPRRGRPPGAGAHRATRRPSMAAVSVAPAGDIRIADPVRHPVAGERWTVSLTPLSGAATGAFHDVVAGEDR